ncbi:MAG: hypothetical protein HFJ49_03260 [Clostridia bacterium]|jgi:hypothetical protein|nr:hypothetical protein [Clostridia bacterium]
MSVAVFKQTLWSKKIQNALDTLTGLRTHCDYQFDGEIKAGNKLKITGSVAPTIGTYVPGTDIEIENVDGNDQELVIDQFRYFARYFDNVDKAQSIPGVLENDSKECAKYLHEEGDKYVAKIMKTEIEKTDSKIKKGTPITPSKSNVVPAVEDGLVSLYEHNVKPTDEIYGEFSPKFYSSIRQALTEVLTNNVELAKKGAVGKYNNILVCIENLLPINTENKVKYNILRTSKAVAFAGQVDTVKAIEKEKGFGDIVKGLYVFGAKVVRPEQIYAILETITVPTQQTTQPEG